MSIDVKVLNKPDNNHVILEINSEKNSKPKYYKVPANSADNFINEYKKNDKKTSIIANTAFVSAVFAGVMLASLATKKLTGTVMKWLIGTAGGIAGAVLSILGTSKYIEKSKNKLLKEQNVQEINPPQFQRIV